MVNAARGEVAMTLGAQDYCLCLTMGALAEIETALGAKNLSDLDQCLDNLRADHLVHIVHALLKGGGEALSLEDVRALPLNIAQATGAIGKAFRAASVSNSDESAP